MFGVWVIKFNFGVINRFLLGGTDWCQGRGGMTAYVVTELFWLVEKLETLRFEQEKSLTQEPSKTSSSKEALACNQDDAILPTESSQKSLRTRLEAAVDGWRQSYEASLQVRKSALEAAE